MRLLEQIRDSGRVFVVAVAGDSGSGKTTFSGGIRRIMGDDMVSSFSLDDYHSLDREQRSTMGITPLDPRANRLDLLAEHLEALREGETVDKPVYDHNTGKIAGTEPFSPTPVVVIEGLHPFYTEKLRSLTDFKVFVDPSRAVKRRWKLSRDVRDRGYRSEDVMGEILDREPDYKLYVDVQKIYAEMVIKIQDTGFSSSTLFSALGVPGASASSRTGGPVAPDLYSVRLIQQMLDPLEEVSMSIDLSQIMRISEHEFSVGFQRDDYYGKRVGVMTIDGEVHQSAVEDLERKLAGILGSYRPICDRQNSYVNATGMAQLILCWRCLEKLKYLMK